MSDAGRLKVTECDDFAAAVQPADVQATQVGRGAFSAVLSSAQLDAVCLQGGRIDSALLLSAGVRRDVVVADIPLELSETVIWNGRRLDEGTFCLAQPGAEHTEYNGGIPGFMLVSTTPDRLTRCLAALAGGRAPALPPYLFVRPAAAVHERMKAALTAVLNATVEHPDVLASPEARADMAQAALTCVCQAVLANTLKRSAPADALERERNRAIRRSEDYLRANMDRPIYLAELCLAAGLNERTLEHVFKRHYGLTPIRVLNLHRLNRARRLLKHPDETIRTVRDAALRCGIWELGRFSVEYRRQFGESPSQTFRRPAPNGWPAERRVRSISHSNRPARPSS